MARTTQHEKTYDRSKYDAMSEAIEYFLESMAYAAPETWAAHVNEFAKRINDIKAQA